MDGGWPLFSLTPFAIGMIRDKLRSWLQPSRDPAGAFFLWLFNPIAKMPILT